MAVIHGQRIRPRQQLGFSSLFAPLRAHVPRQFRRPGHPEILVVCNIVENGRPIALGDARRCRRSDLSCPEAPGLGLLPLAQELPEEGGDTRLAGIHRAWYRLPAALERAVAGLKAEHFRLAKQEGLRAQSSVGRTQR